MQEAEAEAAPKAVAERRPRALRTCGRFSSNVFDSLFLGRRPRLRQGRSGGGGFARVGHGVA